jgi:hypothetical protein
MDQLKEAFVEPGDRPVVGSDSDRSADNQIVRLLSEILAEVQELRQKSEQDGNIFNGVKTHDNDKVIKDNKDASDTYIYSTLSLPDPTMQQSIVEIIQRLTQLSGE